MVSDYLTFFLAALLLEGSILGNLFVWDDQIEKNDPKLEKTEKRLSLLTQTHTR